MIATLEYVEILDHSEKIGKMVLDSEVMEDYKKSRVALDEDQEAQALIKAFNDMKIHYDDIQRFGRYHPDYNEIMKKLDPQNVKWI